MKVGEDIAVPEPPSPEQLMAQMAAMANQMAALQAEILQLRGIHKAKDEDDLEYTPPADAVRKLFADAGPATVPESFSMTPQRGQAAAANAAPMSEDLHYPPADGRGQKQWGSQAAWNEASASWGGPGASWTQ